MVFTGFGDLEISNAVLAQMRNIIIQSAQNPDIINWARNIVSSCSPKDELCEIGSIYAYLQTEFHYVNHTANTQYIETPLEILNTISAGGTFYGDCAEIVTVELSLYRAIGYDTTIRTVNYEPGPFTHVYGLVSIMSGEQIPIELIALPPYDYLGYEKLPYYQKQDYSI